MGWGYNSYGELGTAPSYQPSPVAIPMPTGTGPITATATGSAYGYSNCSFAIQANGDLLAWGSNRSGQLGVGVSVTQTPTPTLVSGIRNVVQVAAGDNYTIALRQDGTVWAWGNNQAGTFGDNTPLNTTRYTPQQIPSSFLHDIRAIAGGDRFCLALDNKGNIYSWGGDVPGELGIGLPVHYGSPQYQLAPVLVTGLTNVRTIDAGNAQAVVVCTDGSVWG
jgi:alpha-tubulin suppressor-like RCC1 family protein